MIIFNHSQLKKQRVEGNPSLPYSHVRPGSSRVAAANHVFLPSTAIRLQSLPATSHPTFPTAVGSPSTQNSPKLSLT